MNLLCQKEIAENQIMDCSKWQFRNRPLAVKVGSPTPKYVRRNTLTRYCYALCLEQLLLHPKTNARTYAQSQLRSCSGITFTLKYLNLVSAALDGVHAAEGALVKLKFWSADTAVDTLQAEKFRLPLFRKPCGSGTGDDNGGYRTTSQNTLNSK